jgi:pyruvate/2-oxoglutarate/acetoin dehydrogenase E1 component
MAPSNRHLKRAFRKLHSEVVKGINADSVIDHLFARRVISEADNLALNEMQRSVKKTRRMMAILHIRNHPAAFTTLRAAMKQEPSYKWLVEKIDRLCRHRASVSIAVQSSFKHFPVRVPLNSQCRQQLRDHAILTRK